jgi:hypothetical protein
LKRLDLRRKDVDLRNMDRSTRLPRSASQIFGRSTHFRISVKNSQLAKLAGSDIVEEEGVLETSVKELDAMSRLERAVQNVELEGHRMLDLYMRPLQLELLPPLQTWEID